MGQAPGASSTEGEPQLNTTQPPQETLQAQPSQPRQTLRGFTELQEEVRALVQVPRPVPRRGNLGSLGEHPHHVRARRGLRRFADER